MATIPGGTNTTPEQNQQTNTLLSQTGVTGDFTPVPGTSGTVFQNSNPDDGTTITAGNLLPTGGTTSFSLTTPGATTTPVPVTFSLLEPGSTVTFILAGRGFVGVSLALTSGGESISDDQADYLLDAATNFGAGAGMLTDMQEALQLLSENGDNLPEDLFTAYVRLVLPADSTLPELKIDVSGYADDFLLAAHLPDLGDATLALAGMEKILVLGEGSVRIDGNQAGMIVGDSSNQVIEGGAGSDTLVGGGGNDTLTGGSSADVFGFSALGHYTITDFIQGYDKLAFDIAGVTSKAQLQSFLTSVVNDGGDTTFNFGASASITLVGVTATGLFDDMLFNIS